VPGAARSSAIPASVAVLKTWLRDKSRGDGRVLFPNARGTRLSPDGVHYLMVKHWAAAKVCPSLKDNASPYMSCATRWPSICCKRASIDPSSPCGSGTNPVHPGEFIRAEILEPHDPSVTAAAQVLGVTRRALSNLPNGQDYASRRVAKGWALTSPSARAAVPAAGRPTSGHIPSGDRDVRPERRWLPFKLTHLGS
jgi:hypothetical protein